MGIELLTVLDIYTNALVDVMVVIMMIVMVVAMMVVMIVVIMVVMGGRRWSCSDRSHPRKLRNPLSPQAFHIFSWELRGNSIAFKELLS